MVNEKKMREESVGGWEEEERRARNEGSIKTGWEDERKN